MTHSDLSGMFGPEVARLVDGVTKLTRLDLLTENKSAEEILERDAQAESIRKMLVAMAEDVRVVVIKLADRLHNMQTLAPLPPNRQRAIAQETLDIYAPLAHRLGMWDIKWQLEDLAFRTLNPGRVQGDLPQAGAPPCRAGGVPQPAVPAGALGAEGCGDPGERLRPAQEHLQHLPEDEQVRGNRAGVRRDPRPVRHPDPRRDQGRLLQHPGRRTPTVAPGAGAIRRLHRDAEGEPVPVAAHDGDVRGRHPNGGAGSHVRDARAGGVRGRGALVVQGGRQEEGRQLQERGSSRRR